MRHQEEECQPSEDDSQAAAGEVEG
jgi:hypothetical protein